MTRTTWVLALALAVAVVVLAAIVEPALAQENAGHNAGKNIGELIRDIATPIAVSVAGLMAIGALVKRDFGMAITLVVMVIVIMGFLIKENPIGRFAEKIWPQIVG